MMQKLLPGMSPSSPHSFFAGRTHEFLTCRHVSKFLNGKLINDSASKFFEEISLMCLIRALTSGTVEVWQLQLLFQELPLILPLKYPAVSEIKKVCIQLIPQLKEQSRMQNNWRRYAQYDYLLDMLKGSD